MPLQTIHGGWQARIVEFRTPPGTQISASAFAPKREGSLTTIPVLVKRRGASALPAVLHPSAGRWINPARNAAVNQARDVGESSFFIIFLRWCARLTPTFSSARNLFARLALHRTPGFPTPARRVCAAAALVEG